MGKQRRSGDKCQRYAIDLAIRLLDRLGTLPVGPKKGLGLRHVRARVQQARDQMEEMEVRHALTCIILVWRHQYHMSAATIAAFLKLHPDSRFWRNTKAVERILIKHRVPDPRVFNSEQLNGVVPPPR